MLNNAWVININEDLDVVKAPYFFGEFFSHIKTAIDDGFDIQNMRTKDWYSYLVENDANLI